MALQRMRILWWPRWRLRDDKLKIPPGPEGSNGIDRFGRRSHACGAATFSGAVNPHSQRGLGQGSGSGIGLLRRGATWRGLRNERRGESGLKPLPQRTSWPPMTWWMAGLWRTSLPAAFAAIDSAALARPLSRALCGRGFSPDSPLRPARDCDDPRAQATAPALNRRRSSTPAHRVRARSSTARSPSSACDRSPRSRRRR